MCWILSLSGKFHGVQKGLKCFENKNGIFFYHIPKRCVTFQIKITMWWSFNLSGQVSLKKSEKSVKKTVIYHCLLL